MIILFYAYAHLALTSQYVVILSSLYDIERAGVTGKYTQVSSAIFSVASSYCPLVRIHFVWTIFKAMSRPRENNPNEKASGRLVCLPFFKFWNRGERFAAPVDWRTAVAEEKVDGTLLKLFHYGGSWRLASNRHLDVHRCVTE